MRLVLVPAPRARALIRIRGLRHGTHGLGCVGVVGATSSPGDGRGGLSSAEVRIATGCGPRGLFQQVTAHELGHALGLGHENRRCATMVASNLIGARRCGSTWLARCRVLQPDDIRGIVHYYGGRAAPIARVVRAACSDRAPASAGTLGVLPDPPGTIATASLAVRGSGGRAIVVGRRRAACPSSPIDARGTFFYARAGARSVPAFGGQAAAGSWCYRVWRLSAGGRWSRPRTVIVAHGARNAAGRIGMTITTTSTGRTIRFTDPQAPAGWRVTVESRDGSCLAPTGSRRTLRFAVNAPGRPDIATDAFPIAPSSARCYRVVVHDGTYPTLDPVFVAALTYQAA
jgi:hypothetical protein